MKAQLFSLRSWADPISNVILELFTISNHRPLIFGHRGAPREAPENTLPAFRRALELGADGIELDVQLSADNQLVVFHDEELSRTSNGRGFVRKFRASELSELDAGQHYSPEFIGTRIATLNEVFENFSARTFINVEIKPFVPIRQTAHLTIETIRHHKMEQQVIISSFNPQVLRQVRRIAPELYIGFLYDQTTPAIFHSQLVSQAIIGNYQGQHPQYTFVDSRTVKRAHQHGHHVNVWTVNERIDIERMVDLGVDIIISDVPGLARSVLRECGLV